MNRYTYKIPATWQMGTYTLTGMKDHREALEFYNDARRRNADREGLAKPQDLGALPRGTYRIKDGETRKRFLRFPVKWEWETQGMYSGKWERLTTDNTRAEALENLRIYRENERGTPFRIRCVKCKD